MEGDTNDNNKSRAYFSQKTKDLVKNIFLILDYISNCNGKMPFTSIDNLSGGKISLVKNNIF